MSARKLRLVLSPNACQDLSDILVYTEQRWGKPQRAAHKAAIDRCLQELRQYPELGRAHEERRLGLRSFQVQQHFIHYRVEPAALPRRLRRIVATRTTGSPGTVIWKRAPR